MSEEERRLQMEEHLVGDLVGAMRRKLSLNRHKGCWDDVDPWWCLQRAVDELGELRRALARAQAGDGSVSDVLHEAADVAIFAAMAADVQRRRMSADLLSRLEEAHDELSREGVSVDVDKEIADLDR